MKNPPVHLVGVICWLPPHKPERPKFPPGESFRALGVFTSDHSSGWTVAFNYAPVSLDGKSECYQVRLYFAFLDNKRDEIKRLSKNTEVIIQDGHKVIAVCRNIQIPETEILMDSPWIDG
jgi:hypothetical protein